MNISELKEKTIVYLNLQHRIYFNTDGWVTVRWVLHTVRNKNPSPLKGFFLLLNSPLSIRLLVRTKLTKWFLKILEEHFQRNQKSDVISTNGLSELASGCIRASCHPAGTCMNNRRSSTVQHQRVPLMAYLQDFFWGSCLRWLKR